MTTVGVANPLLSVIEDLISFTLTLAGILAPILAVMFLVLLGWLAIKILRKISPITQPRASSS
jgi:hypothetical protein